MTKVIPFDENEQKKWEYQQYANQATQAFASLMQIESWMKGRGYTDEITFKLAWPTDLHRWFSSIYECAHYEQYDEGTEAGVEA